MQKHRDFFDLYLGAVPAHQLYRQHLPDFLNGTGLPIKPMGELKDLFRFFEKFALDGDFEDPRGIQDIVRYMIACQDFSQHSQVVNNLVKMSRKKIIRLCRLKDRYSNPTPGGWADLMVNFCFIADPDEHICELQIVHANLLALRGKEAGGHDDYNVVRGAAELYEKIVGVPPTLDGLRSLGGDCEENPRVFFDTDL